jgi:hypothetical protein
MDLDEISGKGMQMFMLNAIGTAAIIKDEEEYLSIKRAEKIEKEKEAQKETERKEKIRTIEDLIQDEDVKKKLMDIRRIYGKEVYLAELKIKAKEFGISLEGINLDDL